MDRLIQLGTDIAGLWGTYWKSYLNGIKNTLILALVATLIGCVIGFVCGILQTIPYSKTDSPVKRFFLALIRADLCRGVPRDAHGAAGSVCVLRASVFHQ